MFLTPTADSEVYWEIISLKNTKRVDAGNLQIKPLKCVADILASTLAYIYNLTLEPSTFSCKMKVAKGNILHKGHDVNNVSNCKPISVLLIFSKPLEKLIHHKITGHLDKHLVITPCKFGFQKLCSTEIALH